MAIRSYKPTSPGRRFQTYRTLEEISGEGPEKSLLRPLKRTGGRNALGRVTSRYKGRRHKRLYRIIDFKSEFTATHSSGVAAVGRSLATLVGFSRQECRMFEIAAYLHDLGKLAVPSEILEKRERLTQAEWGVMRTHAYYTYQILSPIEALNLVASWSSLHQERLDGSGYPFHVGEDDLPLGARVMAVADVFTGITENRPYRKGMAREEALGVLHGMVAKGELDARLVSLLETHFDAISRAREEAQAEAVREYGAFREALTGASSAG